MIARKQVDRLKPWRSACAAILLMPLAATMVQAQEQLVTNGDFAEWDDGAPRDWKVEVGARNGANQPLSEVQKIAGPALMLRGDAATMAWNSVSQEIAVKPGGTYRLEFDARSKDILRQGNQHNNCYVGWLSFDGGGKVIGHEIKDVSQGASDWTHFSVDYSIPQQASKTVVTVFLSKSGLLGVKGVRVAAAKRGENLIANGSLTQWAGNAPQGWTVEVGAKNGAEKPLSKLTKIEGGGVTLSGSAQTMAWRSLSQELTLKPGSTYQLEFEAVAENIRRQGSQYDNCYVGVMSFDGSGNRVDASIEDLSRLRGWKKQKVTFVLPATAKKTSILVFLSKSGTLKVKNMHLGEAVPDRPFR